MRLAAAALVLAVGLAGAAAAPAAFDWRLPAGVGPPLVPADNPMSAAKVELGRRLFYDADLSVDGTLACASCHEQKHAFSAGVALHPGVRDTPARRNAPGLANVAYLSPLTWADPAQKALEGQLATPILGEHPVEMGMHGQEAEIARRLSADPCYRSLFAAAFPERRGEVSLETAGRALAAFERTLLSWNSPYDRARRGEAAALSDEARAGEVVFRRAGCATCHSGPNLTDGAFHVIAAPRAGDLGLQEKTARARDTGAFRTPSLRNVALTGPYLHDGSAPGVRMAIFAHDSAVDRLSQDDAAAISAFLTSLTDRDFVENPRFALPREACGKARTN